MENTAQRWITGLTTISVVATVFASPYAKGILTAFFGGIAATYKSAKK